MRATDRIARKALRKTISRKREATIRLMPTRRMTNAQIIAEAEAIVARQAHIDAAHIDSEWIAGDERERRAFQAEAHTMSPEFWNRCGSGGNN